MSPTKYRRLLTESDAFCMAPWVHLRVAVGGDVTACCEVDRPFGNVKDASLSEIWNGSEMRAFRAGLMRDEQDPRCWKCYEKEKVGAPSIRRRLNERFGRYIDWVETSGEDGRAEDAHPVQWDIGFSNLCNFRCRTCWHGASSQWFDDAVQLGLEIAPTAVVSGSKDPEQLFRELEDWLPHVEEIKFAGGEPLISEEHYWILEELAARELYHVRLHYDTNLSETVYEGVDVTDLWPRFQDVHLRASVDGIGSRAELLRKGLSWPRFVANARRVGSKCPDVTFFTNTVVSVLNVVHLPELQRTLLEQGLVDLGRARLTLAQEPSCYNIRILPRGFKREAAKSLRKHQDWLRELGQRRGCAAKYLAFQVGQIEMVIDFMLSEDESRHLPDFQAITASLDALRSESTKDVLPGWLPS